MKTIIITGTSRGIGAELVKQFASDGHKIIALSRKTNPEFATFSNVIYKSVDLSNVQQLETLTTELKNEFGNIDILIHNAGTIVNKPFAEITAEEFEYVY